MNTNYLIAMMSLGSIIRLYEKDGINTFRESMIYYIDWLKNNNLLKGDCEASETLINIVHETIMNIEGFEHEKEKIKHE